VDREEAIAIAQRCPAAQWATVEVRPLAPCFDESRACAFPGVFTWTGDVENAQPVSSYPQKPLNRLHARPGQSAAARVDAQESAA
jgi:hypothetical protein